MVGCWVTVSNQHLLKWPEFVTTVPKTFRQGFFWQPTPSAVLIMVLSSASCNTFALTLFHLTYIDFFPLFPGLQLGNDTAVVVGFWFFFKINFFPYLCVVVGNFVVVGTCWAWSSKDKALHGSWELPSKVMALPISSSLPES